MRLHDKPLPRFEVSSNFEKFEEQGLVMGAQEGVDNSDVVSVEERGSNAPRDFEKTSEETLNDIITCIGAQNALREILYKILAHCQTSRDFAEVEDFVARQDEFVYSHIIQTPFTLIQMLMHAGGIESTPVDAQGNPVSDAQLEELSEDEADELVASYTLRTTTEGAQAVELLSPDKRIKAQLALHPARRDTYLAVLNYCQEPRTFPEIQEFFKSTPGLVKDVVAGHHKLSPDYYVDKLDKAGALVWRGAWVDTDAGRRMLEGYEPQENACASDTADAVSQQA